MFSSLPVIYLISVIGSNSPRSPFAKYIDKPEETEEIGSPNNICSYSLKSSDCLPSCEDAVVTRMSEIT